MFLGILGRWKHNVFKVTLPVGSSVCTHLLGDEKRDSSETTVDEDVFLHRNRRLHQS